MQLYNFVHNITVNDRVYNTTWYIPYFDILYELHEFNTTLHRLFWSLYQLVIGGLSVPASHWRPVPAGHYLQFQHIFQLYHYLPDKIFSSMGECQCGKHVFTILSLSITMLTHWGRVTHICVSKLTIISSDNSLLPGRPQAIIWTNAGILLIGPLRTNFSEILSEIHSFSFKKMHLKMMPVKWHPFCFSLNVLTHRGSIQGKSYMDCT